MKYPIKTQRLTIRLAESEDAESIFFYRSDLEENKYQGWFPDSVEEVRDYISSMPQSMDVAKQKEHKNSANKCCYWIKILFQITAKK